MEIRRFGVGHRRNDGPPGTRGLEATPLHADERGVVAKLALKPNATIAPHSNPNLAYFLVIEGGGFVQVGDERSRVAAGDAVVWPPNVVHGAWTETTPMRAIVVEFAVADDRPLLIAGPTVGPPAGPGSGAQARPGSVASAEPGSVAPAEPGEVAPAGAPRGLQADGSLAPGPIDPPLDYRSGEQEPW